MMWCYLLSKLIYSVLWELVWQTVTIDTLVWHWGMLGWLVWMWPATKLVFFWHFLKEKHLVITFGNRSSHTDIHVHVHICQSWHNTTWTWGLKKRPSSLSLQLMSPFFIKMLTICHHNFFNGFVTTVTICKWLLPPSPLSNVIKTENICTMVSGCSLSAITFYKRPGQSITY